jgi:hypothetical protein
MADGPNPQRKVNPLDPEKYLPKVFIAYPHKPTVYEQRLPPENAADNREVWRQFEEEVILLKRAEQAEVRAHVGAVRRFADFLNSQSIAVAYDQLVRDPGVDNIYRWCQTQIEDSDYLILITTPSLRHFLNGVCPADQEPLFSSDYLYNLIHSRPQRHDGKPLQIVPLFLSSVKNVDLVPTALKASSIYEVWDEAYREPLSEGLTSLLCRLTGQNRFQQPEPVAAPIIIPQTRRRFGPRAAVTDSAASSRSSTPSNLSLNHRPLDTKTLSKLAERTEFSQRWKQIAVQLGLSKADIERCEGRGGNDENEACLQMLMLSAEKDGRVTLTVAVLSDAIKRSGFLFLYKTLQSVI